MTTAYFTTKKRRTEEVPNVTGGVTTVFHTIDPSTLASYPDSDDAIEFFDLPIGVRIIKSSLRVDADVGASSAVMKLQAKQNGVATDLTATRSMESAGSVIQNVAPPAVSAYITTIQGLMSGGALDAAGNIEVMVQFVNP